MSVIEHELPEVKIPKLRMIDQNSVHKADISSNAAKMLTLILIQLL